MKKIIALLLLVLLSLFGCEKDDVCTDETTPRLILEFYDISNPADLKNVVNLQVQGVGTNTTVLTFNAVSKVALPLDITQDTTKYSLILDAAGTANTDFLQFDYTRQNVFVSRACGYKTIFGLTGFTGVTLTDATPSDALWIQDINVVTTNIETENETHVKIYF